MSIWSANPQPGDWVRLGGRHRVPVTLSDHLTDGGIRPGARGVVTSRSGARAVVKFDAGFGTCHATVRLSDLHVTRRGGGVDAFQDRARTLGWARFGVALALLAPFGLYAVRYIAAHHGVQGLVPSLLIGTLDSFFAVIGSAIANPIQTVIYLVGLAVLSRFAFGRS